MINRIVNIVEDLLKFKRVTKSRFMQEIFFFAVTSIAIGTLAHSVYIAIIIVLDLLLGLLFEFTVDKKIKLMYSIPTYVILHMIFCVLIYYLFAADQLELFGFGLSRFMLSTLLFVYGFGAIRRIKIPPYVHDGYFTINDAREYANKVILVIFYILTGFLLIILLFSGIF